MNMLSTLTCMTRRQSCGAMVDDSAATHLIPTLLSRQSSRPNCASAASTIARACGSSVTSATKAAAVAALRRDHRHGALGPLLIEIDDQHPGGRRGASRMAAARPLPMPSFAALRPR